MFKNIQDISQIFLSEKNKSRNGNQSQQYRVFKTPNIYLGIIVFTLLIIFARFAPIKQGSCFLENNTETQTQNLFFKQTDSIIPESYQSVVIGENSFQQTVPTTIIKSKALGSLLFQDSSRQEISEYIIQQGENLSQIAQKFNLNLNTILWANDLNTGSIVSPGQKLIIPPVDGLVHLVKKGETVSYLAQYYKSKTADIIAFNQISEENEIFSGDILIIPGGEKPAQSIASAGAPLGSSYFICPIPSPCNITQRLHWYNAIDFSNGKCGEAIFAAAGGQVQKTGWHSVAGNYVRVLHPNGVVTFYGHLSAILIVPGQKVSQGEVIGYMGRTGHATGCHVHFEVRGALNPFAY